MLNFLLVLGVVCFSLGLVWLIKLIWLRPFNINHFFERIMLQYALKDPELLSHIGILEKFGLSFHNRKLSNSSISFQLKLYSMVDRNLNLLRSYKDSKLSEQQKLSKSIMDWYLTDQGSSKKFMYHNYPLEQCFGIQNQLPSFMTSTHRISSKKDTENYIIRLSKFPQKLDQVIDGLKVREEKGIIPPKFVIQKVLEEMIAFTSHKPIDHFLYIYVEEKLEKLRNISSETKRNLLNRTAKEISDSVYPSYNRLISYFRYLEEKSNNEDGVWKLPDGDNYYKHLLRHYTTTDLTPEEIHNIGLNQVDEIQKDMRTTLGNLGYNGKSILEHMKEIGQDERFIYPDNDNGRSQALLDYQAIIDEIDNNLNNIFDIRPKVGVRVERIPTFKEKTAPGAYYMRPSMDGSRPGIFYANLLHLPKKYDMATLSYHEAIPGHHFQLAIQQELKGVPTFRKLVPFTAYAEGWALYAEKLAGEQGFFKDQYSFLGYLQSELFRAVRLVVDTGIHHKRWTREEAIDYMIENTGMAPNQVVPEIERYIVMPGQACSYKIGQLQILRLRSLAREKLGETFDIKEFHNVILKNGAMPLSILEKVVIEYIDSAQRMQKEVIV